MVLGLGYVAAAILLDHLSDIGLYRGLGVTPWNPTSGLSLGFTFVFGIAAAPFVLAAELGSFLLLNRAGLPIPWVLALAAASTLVWLGAGLALRSLPDFDPRLGTVPAMLSLIGVGLCVAAVQSAIYLAVLMIAGLATAQLAVPISWRLIVGHLVGVLAVAPPLIMLHVGARWPRPTLLNALQICVLLAALWIVFNFQTATTYQLFYLLFLPVLWAALRDGTPSAVIMINVAQIGIIVGAQMRTDLLPTSGSLQTLMIALALTGLLVGAVVTDRHAAGQRLREQHAALGRALRLRSAGETAAAISHQINQPITAISTYAEVAREAVKGGNIELARETLDKLTEQCDRAAAVVRSIRDLVKQGSLSAAPVRLDELVQWVCKAHEAELAALNIEVEVAVSGNLPTLVADRIQLEQAIDNLITNSIEAIGEGRRPGRIIVSARVESGDAHIEVIDDGPGFAPGLEAIATTPFMTTKRNGTGLGLAIARSVAEAHGGSLAVVHRSTGACVRLRLPTVGRQDDQSNQHH